MKQFCRIGLMLLVVAWSFSAQAADAKKKTKPREFDKVVAVDTTEQEITIYESASKTDVTFKITPFTTIIVNGKHSKLDDVKRGMKVDVMATGAKNANRIEAEDPPLPKKKKK
jgi:hypothetical protein